MPDRPAISLAFSDGDTIHRARDAAAAAAAPAPEPPPDEAA